MPRLKNMKKTETLTKHNSLYWCLFVAPPVRNRKGDIKVLDSSVSLLETQCMIPRVGSGSVARYQDYLAVGRFQQSSNNHNNIRRLT